MLFLLPIRTSTRPWRTPYMNYGLIIANAVIFVLSYYPHVNSMTGAVVTLRGWTEVFNLEPIRPALWQFVSYAFLHHDIMHIIGNMFFLYLFGNNVNDKLGNIGYLCFYLAGAVVSGIGHCLLSSNPVLGASGAVAAVTGAYLVLFPQSLITIFYWLFIFIDTLEIPALYFIGFKLIFWDNIIERRIPNVAYGAHLSGYSFGILAILGLLAVKVIGGDGLDLWSMLKQWNRRRQYRDVVSGDYDPYSASAGVKQVESREVKKSEAEVSRDAKSAELAGQIYRLTSERNFGAATEKYLELMGVDKGYLLSRQPLMDIANQLMSEKRYVESAAAYEQFLAHYSSYEYSEQVELMLGILYGRYLDRGKDAVKYLERAAGKLKDDGQVKMCRSELERLGG